MSPEEVATIGDGPKDIEMLHHVGNGAAMGNASKKIKASADFVTGHHENIANKSPSIFIKPQLNYNAKIPCFLS
jgi:phosphoserine phosphatase